MLIPAAVASGYEPSLPEWGSVFLIYEAQNLSRNIDGMENVKLPPPQHASKRSSSNLVY